MAPPAARPHVRPSSLNARSSLLRVGAAASHAAARRARPRRTRISPPRARRAAARASTPPSPRCRSIRAAAGARGSATGRSPAAPLQKERHRIGRRIGGVLFRVQPEQDVAHRVGVARNADALQRAVAPDVDERRRWSSGSRAPSLHRPQCQAGGPPRRSSPSTCCCGTTRSPTSSERPRRSVAAAAGSARAPPGPTRPARQPPSARPMRRQPQRPHSSGRRPSSCGRAAARCPARSPLRCRER